MRLVVLESPFAGDVEANVAYARCAVRDALARGEAPLASHLLYTQSGLLRDDLPEERQWGIDAGLAWGRVAAATVVYIDLGISRGMAYGIAAAQAAGRTIEYRSLKDEMIEAFGSEPDELAEIVERVAEQTAGALARGAAVDEP